MKLQIAPDNTFTPSAESPINFDPNDFSNIFNFSLENFEDEWSMFRYFCNKDIVDLMVKRTNIFQNIECVGPLVEVDSSDIEDYICQFLQHRNEFEDASDINIYEFGWETQDRFKTFLYAMMPNSQLMCIPDFPAYGMIYFTLNKILKESDTFYVPSSYFYAVRTTLIKNDPTSEFVYQLIDAESGFILKVSLGKIGVKDSFKNVGLISNNLKKNSVLFCDKNLLGSSLVEHMRNRNIFVCGEINWEATREIKHFLKCFTDITTKNIFFESGGLTMFYLVDTQKRFFLSTFLRATDTRTVRYKIKNVNSFVNLPLSVILHDQKKPMTLLFDQLRVKCSNSPGSKIAKFSYILDVMLVNAYIMWSKKKNSTLSKSGFLKFQKGVAYSYMRDVSEQPNTANASSSA